ncbi:MAG: hypothetical protein IIY02_01045 [Firmicutes bacterium]|nr:hypothetical protein [Bacillota bacterium]
MKMNIYFFLEGLFLLGMSFLFGNDFDDETVILSEQFDKHTIKLKPSVRRFFCFKNRNQRKRFCLVAVLMEIVGYIFATVFIVASFFVEQTKVPFDLFGVDPTVTLFYLGIFIFANIMLFLLVFFGFYYEKKRWKFMKTTKAYQQKSKFEKFIAHFSRDQ